MHSPGGSCTHGKERGHHYQPKVLWCARHCLPFFWWHYGNTLLFHFFFCSFALSTVLHLCSETHAHTHAHTLPLTPIALSLFLTWITGLQASIFSIPWPRWRLGPHTRGMGTLAQSHHGFAPAVTKVPRGRRTLQERKKEKEEKEGSRLHKPATQKEEKEEARIRAIAVFLWTIYFYILIPITQDCLLLSLRMILSFWVGFNHFVFLNHFQSILEARGLPRTYMSNVGFVEPRCTLSFGTQVFQTEKSRRNRGTCRWNEKFNMYVVNACDIGILIMI